MACRTSKIALIFWIDSIKEHTEQLKNGILLNFRKYFRPVSQEINSKYIIKLYENAYILKI